MDYSASRRLMRRARIQRSHERQARVAAARSKKKQPLGEREAPVLICDSSTTEYESSFPSLENSQYFTSQSMITEDSNPVVSKPRPIQESSNSVSTSKLITLQVPCNENGTWRDRCKKRVRRKAFNSGCFSDSNLKAETDYDSDNLRSGHFSDTAFLVKQLHLRNGKKPSYSHPLESRIKRQRGDTTCTNRTFETTSQFCSSVAPRRSRRLTPIMRNVQQIEGNMDHSSLSKLASSSVSKIEEESDVLVGIDNESWQLESERNISEYGSTEVPTHINYDTESSGGNQSWSDPAAPTFSRMVREKTKGLDISENVLQEVIEMNNNLQVVNWMLEPTANHRVPLPSYFHGNGGPNEVAAPVGNLVMVRGGPTGGNWFDQPKRCVFLGETEDPDPANHERMKEEELFSPLSTHSDLLSDYEEELKNLI